MGGIPSRPLTGGGGAFLGWVAENPAPKAPENTFLCPHNIDPKIDQFEGNIVVLETFVFRCRIFSRPTPTHAHSLPPHFGLDFQWDGTPPSPRHPDGAGPAGLTELQRTAVVLWGTTDQSMCGFSHWLPTTCFRTTSLGKGHRVPQGMAVGWVGGYGKPGTAPCGQPPTTANYRRRTHKCQRSSPNR